MTMTETNHNALEAIFGHHELLVEGVTRRVGALSESVEAGGYQAAAAELVTYLAEQVLTHAVGEEPTIYQAAFAKEGLGEIVTAMVDEHRELAALSERLAMSKDGAEALSIARSIEALFQSHVTKENKDVLPPLAFDERVDLAGLLGQMHRLTDAAQEEAPVATDLSIPDVEATLVGLALGAAGQLADLGRGEAGCRLAAETWVAVRVARPELAVRVTAALHGLVRSLTSEPVTLGAPRGVDAILDVRELAPARRHETIFSTYDALRPSAGFVLVNDHDPKPLRYQFEAEHAGEFTWDYLEAGPKVWRVRIARAAGASR